MNEIKINKCIYLFSVLFFYDKKPGLGSQIPKLAYPMIPIPIPYKNFTMITSSRQNSYWPQLFYEM